MLLAKIRKQQNRLPAKQAEITYLRNNAFVHHGLHEPVKPARSHALKKSVALATDSLSRDDVVSLLEKIQHGGQEIRRVLQIGVHYHNSIAFREVKAGCDCRLMPEIARKPQDLYSLIVAHTIPQDFSAAITASVVNEQ